MRKLPGLFAAIAGVCSFLAGPQLGAGVDSSKEVKVSAKASKLDASGKQTITVTFSINPRWHIYANPVDNDEFPETIVNVKSKVALKEIKVLYPPGKTRIDVDGKKKETRYKIYVDKVEVQANIQRAPGDSGPLEVSTRFMACDDKVCLQVATPKITVK